MKTLRFIFIIFIFTSCCTKCDEKCEKFYNFETEYHILPERDSFQVNDTFWLSCEFHTNLVSDDGSIINFTNQDLLTVMFLGRIDTIPTIQNFGDFEIITDIGKLEYFSITGVSGFDVKPDKSDTTVKLNCGLVPKTRGLYKITISSDYNIDNEFGPEIETIADCDEYIDNFAISLNKGSDNNFHFLQNAASDSWKNLPQSDFINEGGYCFYVK